MPGTRAGQPAHLDLRMPVPLPHAAMCATRMKVEQRAAHPHGLLGQGVPRLVTDVAAGSARMTTRVVPSSRRFAALATPRLPPCRPHQ